MVHARSYLQTILWLPPPQHDANGQDAKNDTASTRYSTVKEGAHQKSHQRVSNMMEDTREGMRGMKVGGQPGVQGMPALFFNFSTL